MIGPYHVSLTRDLCKLHSLNAQASKLADLKMQHIEETKRFPGLEERSASILKAAQQRRDGLKRELYGS